jgi:hypothetical protein
VGDTFKQPEFFPVIDRFDLSRIHEAIHATRDAHKPGKILLTG